MGALLVVEEAVEERVEEVVHHEERGQSDDRVEESELRGAPALRRVRLNQSEKAEFHCRPKAQQGPGAQLWQR